MTGLLLLLQTYGRDAALKWLVYWRLFYLACSELFGYNGGEEWGVGHYLFVKSGAATAAGKGRGRGACGGRRRGRRRSGFVDVVVRLLVADAKCGLAWGRGAHTGGRASSRTFLAPPVPNSTTTTAASRILERPLPPFPSLPFHLLRTSAIASQLYVGNPQLLPYGPSTPPHPTEP